MRIEGPKSTSETSAKKTASKADGSGSFGALLATGGSKASSETKSVSHTSDISSLIAIQAADDVQERQKRKRMRSRADALLKLLDHLRLALMNGTVTLSHLHDLDSLLVQAREHIEDQALQSILDEVELRAAVERAKLEYARDNA